MITYKVGDLLEVTDGILAHGCNMRGVMGSGVARQVKAKYPGAFAAYEQDLKSGYLLGGVFFGDLEIQIHQLDFSWVTV